MTNKHYCIDCGKELSKKKYKRCRSCSQIGNLNHNFGKLSKQNLCKCGNLKNRTSLKCRKCADKIHSKKMRKNFKANDNHPFKPKFGKPSNRYIDGRKNKIYYCKICGVNKVGYRTYWVGKGRCKLCAKNKDSYKIFRENNPNWNGGKSFEPYPLGWNRTFKEQIRYRDGYKCQICGVPEIECKSKLHVHHKDYDKENLKLDNLVSLCQSCHMKTNYNREYWERYFNQISVLVRKSS
jgi:5-methylcytosine-specific restriction endonuclease McrA